MSDFINREELIADLLTVDPQYETMIDWCIRVLKAQPPIDAEPVRHGHWMPIYERYEDGDYLIGEKCSECGETLSFKPPFCPYCGAKMDEVTE